MESWAVVFTEARRMAVCIAEEVCDARFGDQRLTKRLTRIAERFWQKPNMSIPAASDGRAEMEAAYRFFDNPKVTPECIRATHVVKTVDRIRQTTVALLVQDTTAIDLTRPQEQVKGAGPIDCESRIGMLYHPLMAFDSEGLSLGTVWSKSWVRESIRTHLSPAEKDKLRKQTPIEDKESSRWLEGLRAARDIAESVPATQCVCIADSEADIYEFFAEPLATTAGQVHVLIRGCYDRSLMNRSESLLTAARSAPCIAQCMVDVSRRESSLPKDSRKRSASRDGRIAEVEVRACSLVLRPPPRHDRELPEVRVNVVLVEEPAPPEGQQPIQWILVTTLPIDTDEQVRTIVRYYCIRWQIEVYFRTLKSGCRIEARYFERIGRLQNCLAVYYIIAWKILYMCRLSRECPDLPCDVIFDESEWKPVCITLKRQIPVMPPTLNEMVRLVASLGGYVIRKNTNPGTQTLWLGLQRLHDLSTAWKSFGPDTRH